VIAPGPPELAQRGSPATPPKTVTGGIRIRQHALRGSLSITLSERTRSASKPGALRNAAKGLSRQTWEVATANTEPRDRSSWTWLDKIEKAANGYASADAG
jgi:hypothetical protein